MPGASIVTRPRLSQLEFAGDRKITRQPRRTAIVAFSADEVYAIAELIRRQHGGAAVVLGSLSPRTRNAQVEMFQNGDVDYLVATDAVGMGLNLDVDHVAFASDRKFDGYQFRRLNPSEFSQIAGRAGRATRDGTFGTTGRCAPFEPELVNALQNHTFESVKVLQWRNAKLDFSSIGALQVSLAQTPNHDALTRAPIAEDLRVLDHAARDADVRDMAQGKVAVERLWDACQIPDYRRVAPAAHAELVTTLFGFLMKRGRVPDAWFGQQIVQNDRTDGDIDTLSGRIAQIRTWTFVANRPDWLSDPDHWQGISREIENKLSDALHERLTERFVDRRTSVLMRRLRENTMLNTEIDKTGEVKVEGHVIGRLDGFTFAPSAAEAGSDAKALQATAQKALAGEIDARAEKLSNAPDDQFVLTSDGTVRWTGDAVARLVGTDNVLVPRLRIISDERLTGAPRDNVQTRLDLWLKTHVEKLLGPLFDLTKAEDITGIGRGIAFQLIEALGVLERTKIAAEMKDLDQASRASLRKYGVRFGAYHIYIPSLLKPAARAIASLLWAQKHDNVDLSALSGAQQLAGSGRTSFAVDKALDRDAYRILGYKQCGERAVRVDILERLADLIRPALSWRPGANGEKPAGAFDGRTFVVTQAMTSLTGSAGEDFASVLRALGYRMENKPALPPEPPKVVAETTPVAEASVTEAPVAEDVVAESDAGPVESAPPSDDANVVEPAIAVETSDIADITPDVAEAVTETAPSALLLPEIAFAPAGEADAERADAAQAELQPDPAVGVANEPPAAIDTSASLDTPNVLEADAAKEAIAADAAPAEPVMVEVWRPGGRPDDQRRPRHDRNASRHRGNAKPVAIGGGDAEGRPTHDSGETTNAARPANERHHRDRHRRPDFRKPRTDAPATANATPATGDAALQQTGRPPRDNYKGTRDNNRDNAKSGDRFQGKSSGGKPQGKGGDRDKFKGPRDRDRDNRRDDRGGGAALRQYASSAPPQRERDRPADPNSPFAKLAALKEQLASGRKDG